MVLQGFLNNTSSALESHAAQASSNRSVDVNTSYSVTTESAKETSLTREFKNINNGKVLNVIYRQLNQGFEIVQHMTDIKVGYIDPSPRSFNTVSLQELDSLLATVLVDNPEKRLAYKQRMIHRRINIQQV